MLAPVNGTTLAPTYQCENLAQWVADAGDLIMCEAEEAGLAPLCPNVADYEARERNKSLLIITARLNGKLCGYLVYNVFPHPHYMLLAAEPDLFYVGREYRRLNVGIGLLRCAEYIMRESGIKIWCARVPQGASHGRFYERMGFKPVEMLYIKML